ncbi:MAG: MbcA/ParS/Xre antitoxin family protein [Idiomarina sp.]|nr:MbcA/ParS/Xre antitoxin family protein [Idiomarina sp.]
MALAEAQKQLDAELNSFFMKDKEMMGEWLTSHLPALNGLQPVVLMDTEDGVKTLLKILDDMKYGDLI